MASPPALVLLSPCSGPVRRAAPAGVEAVVFSLAEGLREAFAVQVAATPDSELPDGAALLPCRHADLPGMTARLLARSGPATVFCDHSGAAIHDAGHPGFFRIFHVEPRYVFTPATPQRCGFVSAYLRDLFAAQRSPHFASCPILPNGIDPGVGAESIDLSPRSARALYLGRINRLKGLDLGVAACASLGLPLDIHGGFGAERAPDIVFNDLPLLDELTRIFPDTAAYHGPLRDMARKRACLARAAAALIPSREAESCSLVALEGVAAGVPVVTFRRGGVVDYLGDHPGVFFAEHTGRDAEDIAALAGALRRAMSAPRLAPSLPARYTAAAMVERYRAWLAPG